MPLSESDTADESLDFPQADSDNASLQTWVLHGDAWWLCGHMGRNSWWFHQAHEFIMTKSEVPTQQKVYSMRVSCKQDPTPFSSIREKPRGDMENRPPPVPAQGFKSNSDKMLDVQQPPFLICCAHRDEKVASGRSRPLWRGFIRYYNLSFLQGRGQRWLLFAPYFMARKIIDPNRVHLVHMEVLCRNGLCSTRCSAALNGRKSTKKERKFNHFVTKWNQRFISLSAVGSGLQTATCDNLMSGQAATISESVVFVQSCWAW